MAAAQIVVKRRLGKLVVPVPAGDGGVDLPRRDGRRTEVQQLQVGGAGFLKSLAAPTPIMTPMNILEIAIRPTSLCMRLFGNVLGAFVIMELIKLVVPVFVPAVFSLYFDLFDGLIQTYVFVFLTSLFMKESLGDEE